MTEPLREGERKLTVESDDKLLSDPAHPEPVNETDSGAADADPAVREVASGDDGSAAGDVDPELGESVAAGSDGPSLETVGRGWVVPPGGSRVDALFMISPGRLGFGRSDSDGDPVWFELIDIVNLDAIGDPLDELIEVELSHSDGTKISAGWTEAFCAVVVNALSATVGPSEVAEESTIRRNEIDDAHSDSASSAGGAISDEGTGEHRDDPAADEDGRTPTGILELEDVTYLGGFPGHPRRKKRCTATLSDDGIEVHGPSDIKMRLAWGAVRSIEAQNSDEARFRTNTKIHQDSSALVFECDEDVTVMLEARDCPTIPLRQAIGTLLEGVAVKVK